MDYNSFVEGTNRKDDGVLVMEGKNNRLASWMESGENVAARFSNDPSLAEGFPIRFKIVRIYIITDSITISKFVCIIQMCRSQ